MLITLTAKKPFFRIISVLHGCCLLMLACSKDIAPTVDIPTASGTWTIHGETSEAKSKIIDSTSLSWFDMLNGHLNPKASKNTISITFSEVIPAEGIFNIGLLDSDTSSVIPNNATISVIRNGNSPNKVSYLSSGIVSLQPVTGRIQVANGKKYIYIDPIKIYQLGKNSSEYVDSTILSVNGLEY